MWDVQDLPPHRRSHRHCSKQRRDCSPSGARRPYSREFDRRPGNPLRSIERERDAKTNGLIVLRNGARPSVRRPHAPGQGREAATANDTDLAAARLGEGRAVAWNFAHVRCPAILDPFPCVTVHVSNTPRVGPEHANLERSIGRRIAAAAGAPTEGGAEILQSRVGAEFRLIHAKAVAGCCPGPCGVFPFRLRRQPIGSAGTPPEPSDVGLGIVSANAHRGMRSCNLETRLRNDACGPLHITFSPPICMSMWHLLPAARPVSETKAEN